MKYFLTFISILSLIFLTLFFILFTQSGNNILKPYIQKYLKEELKKEIKIEAFTLKTNFLDTEIIIDKNSKIILNGNFNLLEKVFDFDYIVDSKNLQTPYIIITQPLHVEGKFVGNLKEFQLNGRGKAFRSNIRFFVDMEDKNIKNIKLNAKNVKMEDVLSILKKPIYTKGMFDINIDVKQTQKDIYKGKGDVQIHYGVLNEKILQKNFSQAITYRGNITANIDGNTISTKGNVVSNIAKIDILNGKYNIKKKLFKGNYTLFLPDLNLLSQLLNSPIRGSILFSGEIKKDKDIFSINTTANTLGGKLKAILQNETAKIELENINLPDLFYMLKKPQYSNGKLNLIANIDNITKNKKGKISLHVTNSNLYLKELGVDSDIDFVPYIASLEANIDNNLVNFIADIKSKIANLKIKNSKYELNNTKLYGNYTLHVEDLNNLKFLTNKELKGNITIDGKYSYDKTLYVDGRSDFLEAKSVFDLKDNLFSLKSEDLAIENITDMLLYPRVFNSFSSLILNYNIDTKKGDLLLEALNGKIVANEFTELLFLASKFDLSQEIYKDITFKDH